MSEEQVELLDFDPVFQADLLSVMLTNKDRFHEARTYIDADVFTIPECRWLFEHADSCIQSSGELPTRGLVSQEARSAFGEGEFEVLIEVHKDLTSGRSSPKEILASASRFAEDSKYRAIAEKHDRLKEMGKLNEARALMELQGWKNPQKLSSKAKMLLGWNDTDEFLKRAMSRRDDPDAFKFSTGVRDLDALMKGGYAKKHMVLVLGWTGRGKSTVAVNLASTNVRGGHAGLYISTEMPVDEIFAKMVARETMTAYNTIYEYGFNPEEEERFLKQLSFKQENYKDLLAIVQTGIDGTTRASILNAIDSAAQALGVPPAWIVLDTIDHTKYDLSRGKTEGMGDNMNWMSGVLDTYDAGGVITSQANRDGVDRTDESNAANTIEGARVAPWIIAVNEADDLSRPDPHADIDELLEERAIFETKVLSLVKARHGKPGEVPVSTDLECSFIGDIQIERAMNS